MKSKQFLTNALMGTSLSTLALLSGHQPALAVSGFTGIFQESNFTFSPSGTVNISGADSEDAVIEVDASGETTWTNAGTNITESGTIFFSWNFAADFFLLDEAFYSIDGTQITLSQGSGSSTQTEEVPIISGQSFAFGINSLDGTGEQLTITNFHFQPTPVPLESDALPIVLSAGFMGGGMWLKRWLKRSKS